MKVSEILYKSFLWRGVQFFLSFLINIILAQVLGAAITGEFFTLIYIYTTIAYMLGLGLDVAFVYFISKKLISYSKVFKIVVSLSVIAIVASFFILNILSHTYKFSFFSERQFIYYGLIFVVSNICFVLFTAILTALNKYHIALITLIIGTLINIVFILYFLFSNGKTDWHNYFLIYFLVTFLQSIFLYGYIFKIKNKAFPPISKNIKSVHLFKYALNKFLISVLFLLATRWAIYVFPYSFLQETVKGNYIQMFRMNEYMATITSFIYLPLIAISTNNKNKQNVAMVSFFIRIVHTALLVYAIFMLFVQDFFFTILFGTTYSSMNELFFIMFPGLLALCASPFITGFFFGQKKNKYNLISAVIAFLLAAVLYFPLIHLFEIRGVALSWSIAMFASYAYDIFILRKHYKVSFRELLFMKSKDFSFITTTVKSILYKKR